MFAGDWLYSEWFEKEGVPTLYKAILVEMAVAVLINVALNFWWSFLIIRQVYRLIKGGLGADATYAGDDEGKDGDKVKSNNVTGE